MIRQFFINRAGCTITDGMRGGLRVNLSYICPDNPLSKILRRNDHPNKLEYKAILDCLKAYAREIVCSDYRTTRVAKNIDMRFGFTRGRPEQVEGVGKYFFYGTGASSQYQLDAYNSLYSEVFGRYRFLANNNFRKPDFFNGLDERLCDRIYLIGNEWTKSTYGVHGRKVRLLPGIALTNDSFSYSLGSERTDILWLGSKGVIHKGLHIAVEVARLMARKLVVVGVRDSEYRLASELLTNSGVRYEVHGYVDIGSTAWLDIVEKCRIVLGVSISEGMSTALLTAAAHGIFPISTRSCGIDYGYVTDYCFGEPMLTRLCELSQKVFDEPASSLDDAMINQIQLIRRRNSKNAYSDRLAQHFEADLRAIEHSL